MIIDHTKNPKEVLCKAARICIGSDQMPTHPTEFLVGLKKKGHMSIFEHFNITWKVEDLSRVASHQLVRHRTFKFSQESLRYTNSSKHPAVLPDKRLKPYLEEIRGIVQKAKEEIPDLKFEDYRYLEPQAVASRMVFTTDFRNLMHFFNLRCDKHAQKEIRGLADAMKEELFRKFPFTKSVVEYERNQ